MPPDLLSRLRRKTAAPPTEFLIVGRSLAARIGDGASVLERAAFTDAPVSRIDAEDFSVYSTAAFQGGGAQWLFDGYAFGKRLLHARCAPPSARDLRRVMDNTRTVGGNYLVGEVRPREDRFRVRTDLLGQYQLFYHLADGDFAVSNNPYALEALGGGAGRSAGRSAENVCMSLTYLSKFGGVSSFTTVHDLPPRHEIRYSPEGGLTVAEHTSRHELLVRGGEYDDLVEEAAAEIARNCELIADLADSGVYTVADLSGGVDTRLVLAGFLRAGRTNSVAFFNVSTEPERRSPDRLVADSLMRDYQLSPGRGVTDGPHSPTTFNSHKAFTYGGGEIAHGSAHYLGLLPSGQEDWGELYLDGYCRVGGYCGEHTRAVGPNLGATLKGAPDPHAITEAFVDRQTRPDANNGARFLTPAGVASARDTFSAYFAELLPALPDPKLVNTLTYVENRSRCHFGVRSMNANRSRISVSPLLTPQLMALHEKLSYRQLHNNKIAYDLIVRLAGRELAHRPYATFRWGKYAVGPDDHPEYLAGLKVVNASVPADSHAHPGDPILLARDGAAEDSPYDAWLAASGEPPTRASAIRFLLEAIPPGDAVWDLLDRAEVESAAREEDATGVHGSAPGEGPHRWRSWNVDRLASALTFYAGLSVRSRLTDRVDVRELVRGEHA